ncbi:MAG: hypothetical protein WKF75_17195 [Singulisphaera sp.]
MLAGLQTRNLPNSSIYDVYLEGNDRERTTKLLNKLLDIFREDAKREQDVRIEESRRLADASLMQLGGELNALEQTIINLLGRSSIFTPDGDSLVAQQHAVFSAALVQERFRLDEALQEAQIARMFPHLRLKSEASPQQTRIAMLLGEKKRLTQRLQRLQGLVRDINNDPASRQPANCSDRPWTRSKRRCARCRKVRPRTPRP